MAAIDISIGHDDDLVVAEPAEVHSLDPVLILLGHCDSKSGVDIPDLLTVESAVSGRLLDVEDLTPQRKDSLDATVAALLGRTACGISLNEEELAPFGIPFGAVGEFAGHSRPGEGGLALHHRAGLAGSLPGGGGKDDLLDDHLALLGMLLKILLHCGGSGLGNGGGRLRVTKLRLGLSLELRLSDLHGHDSRQTLAEILRSEVSLELGEKVVFLGIVLKRAGKAHLESLQVGTTFDRVDVVDVGIYLL